MQRLIFFVAISSVLLFDNGQILSAIGCRILTAEMDHKSSTPSAPTNQIEEENRKMELKKSIRLSPQCPVLSYHPGSEIGHQSTCPFDWVVDIDPNRIPEKIIQQICHPKCRSCGPFYSCVQLQIRSDIYYRDTNEMARLQVRAGCVCMPQRIGSSALSFDI